MVTLRSHGLSCGIYGEVVRHKPSDTDEVFSLVNKSILQISYIMVVWVGGETSAINERLRNLATLFIKRK